MAARLNPAPEQLTRVPSRSKTPCWGLITFAFAFVLGACDAPDSAQTPPENGRLDVWAKARQQGVDFRATGNEPGWVLEIRDGESVVLVADYGSSRYEIARPETAMDPVSGGRVLRSAGSPAGFEVILIDQPCSDDMSGESFPTTVLLKLGEQHLRGCGRTLGAVL